MNKIIIYDRQVIPKSNSCKQQVRGHQERYFQGLPNCNCCLHFSFDLTFRLEYFHQKYAVFVKAQVGYY